MCIRDRCGRALSRRRVRHAYGVYEYYICPTYKQSHEACTPHSVRVDAVEREVLSAIRDEIRAAVDFSRVAAELKTVHREKSSLSALERSLSRVMELKRGIYGDWKDGELTREEYLSFKEGYDRQETELRRQIEAEKTRAASGGGGEWTKLAALGCPETVSYTHLDVYKRQVTKRIAKARAIKLMEEVGIAEPRKRYNQYPFEFSGGMRQRIVIAIALAANPDILICDEPTTALDVTIQSQILELINRLKRERPLSVIFITHDLGAVSYTHLQRFRGFHDPEYRGHGYHHEPEAVVRRAQRHDRDGGRHGV